MNPNRPLSYYQLGAITVTNGSKVITGYKTEWQSTLLQSKPMVGSLITVDQVKFYVIESIDDDSTIRINKPYAQAGQVNTSYLIINELKVNPAADDKALLGDILKAVNEGVGKVNTKISELDKKQQEIDKKHVEAMQKIADFLNQLKGINLHNQNASEVPTNQDVNADLPDDVQKVLDILWKRPSGGVGTDDQNATEVPTNQAAHSDLPDTVQKALDALWGRPSGNAGSDDQTASEVPTNNNTNPSLPADVQRALDALWPLSSKNLTFPILGEYHIEATKNDAKKNGGAWNNLNRQFYVNYKNAAGIDISKEAKTMLNSNRLKVYLEFFDGTRSYHIPSEGVFFDDSSELINFGIAHNMRPPSSGATVTIGVSIGEPTLPGLDRAYARIRTSGGSDELIAIDHNDNKSPFWLGYFEAMIEDPQRTYILTSMFTYTDKNLAAGTKFKLGMYNAVGKSINAGFHGLINQDFTLVIANEMGTHWTMVNAKFDDYSDWSELGFTLSDYTGDGNSDPLFELYDGDKYQIALIPKSIFGGSSKPSTGYKMTIGNGTGKKAAMFGFSAADSIGAIAPAKWEDGSGSTIAHLFFGLPTVSGDNNDGFLHFKSSSGSKWKGKEAIDLSVAGIKTKMFWNPNSGEYWAGSANAQDIGLYFQGHVAYTEVPILIGSESIDIGIPPNKNLTLPSGTTAHGSVYEYQFEVGDGDGSKSPPSYGLFGASNIGSISPNEFHGKGWIKPFRNLYVMKGSSGLMDVSAENGDTLGWEGHKHIAIECLGVTEYLDLSGFNFTSTVAREMEKALAGAVGKTVTLRIQGFTNTGHNFPESGSAALAGVHKFKMIPGGDANSPKIGIDHSGTRNQGTLTPDTWHDGYDKISLLSVNKSNKNFIFKSESGAKWDNADSLEFSFSGFNNKITVTWSAGSYWYYSSGQDDLYNYLLQSSVTNTEVDVTITKV